MALERIGYCLFVPILRTILSAQQQQNPFCGIYGARTGSFGSKLLPPGLKVLKILLVFFWRAAEIARDLGYKLQPGLARAEDTGLEINFRIFVD